MPRETIISHPGRQGPAKAGKQEPSPPHTAPFPPGWGGGQPGAENKCCVKGKADFTGGRRWRGWPCLASSRTLHCQGRVREQLVIPKRSHRSFPTPGLPHTRQQPPCEVRAGGFVPQGTLQLRSEVLTRKASISLSDTSPQAQLLPGGPAPCPQTCVNPSLTLLHLSLPFHLLPSLPLLLESPPPWVPDPVHLSRESPLSRLNSSSASRLSGAPLSHSRDAKR